MSEVIRTRREGGVIEVTLDRPRANAIDLVTSRIMGETFKAFRNDPELRVAIVTGAGEKFFSAGWDLKAAADGDAVDGEYGAGGFGGLQELPGLDKPVIAAVNGMAVGGGFELALSCDLILASSTASFALPEIRAGTLADAATIKLPKRMPFHIAMELLFTGRWMDAAEAHRWGVVNEVVEPAKLLDRAWELARRLESGPAAGLRRHQGGGARSREPARQRRPQPRRQTPVPDRRPAVRQRGPDGRISRVRGEARSGVEGALAEGGVDPGLDPLHMRRRRATRPR